MTGDDISQKREEEHVYNSDEEESFVEFDTTEPLPCTQPVEHGSANGSPHCPFVGCEPQILVCVIVGFVEIFYLS
jgi:hypothetical protein